MDLFIVYLGVDVVDNHHQMINEKESDSKAVNERISLLTKAVTIRGQPIGILV